MHLPEGAEQQFKTDSALVKALARAFRWKRMLDTGEFTTIAELAAHDGIACSYMTCLTSRKIQHSQHCLKQHRRFTARRQNLF